MAIIISAEVHNKTEWGAIFISANHSKFNILALGLLSKDRPFCRGIAPTVVDLSNLQQAERAFFVCPERGLMMEQEIWKQIPGYPDYQASNLGRIRSFKRGREHVLKPSISPEGYPQVILSNGEGVRNKKVHNLIALAFIGPRPKGYDTCHNDGDRRNNQPNNLRYDTRRGNILDGFAHGTLKNKLTLDQASEVKRLYSEGVSSSLLAKKYQVSTGTIQSLVRGKSYILAGGGVISGEIIDQYERAKNIRLEYASNKTTVTALARKYGIDKATISRIINGKTYPNAGGPIKGVDYQKTYKIKDRATETAVEVEE